MGDMGLTLLDFSSWEHRAGREGGDPAGKLREIAHVEIRGAEASVGPLDVDACEAETSCYAQVVVPVRGDVPPRGAERNAPAPRDAPPELRLWLVAAGLLRADPAVQIESQCPLDLAPMTLVAVRGRHAGRVRAETSQGFPRIGEERPRADPVADRASRLERQAEGQDEALRHDRVVGAVASR